MLSYDVVCEMERVEEGGVVFVELEASHHVVEPHAARAARSSGRRLVLQNLRVQCRQHTLPKLLELSPICNMEMDLRDADTGLTLLVE